MSWMTLQLTSMLLLSANSIVDKRLVRDHALSPVVYLASFAAVGLVVFIIGVWNVPWMGLKAVGLGLMSGVLLSGAVILYYQAMSLEDVSRIIPMLRLSEVLKLILLAVLLDDQLSWLQYAASVFMLVGASTLVRKTGQKQTAFRSKWTLNRGLALIGFVAVLLAFSGVIDSHLNLEYSPWVLLVWSQAGTFLGFCLALLFRSQRVEFRESMAVISSTLCWTIVGQQVLRLGIGLLSQFAVNQAGSAAITSVFGGVRPLLVLVMAMIFLGEGLERTEVIPKLTGIGLMGVGTALLFLG